MIATDSETIVSSTLRSRIYSSVWLDDLPMELCTRIASLLSLDSDTPEESTRYIPDALSLAAVSPDQKKAVASAQSGSLRIGQVRNVEQTIILIRMWCEVLDTISEVVLPHDVPDRNIVKHLLSRPSIQKAVVINYPYITRSLKAGGSVRCLELHLTMYCPQNGKRGLSTRVSDLLRICPIEELRLVCQGCGPCPSRVCVLVRFLIPINDSREYPILRSLHVKCTSRRMEKLPIVASSFPRLEELRLEHWKPIDHDLDKPVELDLTSYVSEALLKMKNVQLIHYGRVENFVPLLGSRLTGIASASPVSSTVAGMLSSCTCLRVLDIVLEPQVEMFIPTDLTNLKSLSLRWISSGRASTRHLYSPISEYLLQLVQRNSEISELRLRNVKIDSSLLAEIIHSTGSKLCTLELPIFFQDETSALRFSRLASLIVHNCPVLQDLETCSESLRKASTIPKFRNHEIGACDPAKCEFCMLLEKIDCGLRVFSKRLLRFRDAGVRRLRSWLQPWSWQEEIPECI